jgi:8-oxo-dGTP pyrophosphatase MutT (NUDIX family)
MDHPNKQKFEDSPKHVLAAASLVRNGSGDVLLIEGPGRGWECPGGRIEEGEDLFSGLEREIYEEAGVAAEIGQLTGIYLNLSIGVMIFCFLSTYVSGNLRTSPESLRVEWFGEDECLDRISHPVIRERVNDMINYTGKIIYKAYTINPYRVVEEKFL